MTAKRSLARFSAPGQRDAEMRTWDVVRGAFEQREAGTRRRAHGGHVVGLASALVLAGSLALTPAGATVGHLISRALGVQHASRALISLPAPGRLLVSSGAGTWTVAPGGSKRWIGPWTEATWSPHGRYVAVARRNELAAVTPLGVIQWVVQQPHISDPRWYPLSGYRVAYLSGSDLRVVAGDGSGDHLVGARVARVAPAWRPGHPYQLAYVSSDGRIAVRDGDAGALRWSARPGVRVRGLAWSAGGGRLLALSTRRVLVYSGSGRLLSAQAAPGKAPIHNGALSPDGRTVSIVSGGPTRSVIVYSLAGRRRALVRRVLTGTGLGQVVFSPNGRWVLITWPAADQWVFVRVVGSPRIAAVSGIDRHFSSHKNSRFPHLDGWCCSATGAAG